MLVERVIGSKTSKDARAQFSTDMQRVYRNKWKGHFWRGRVDVTLALGLPAPQLWEVTAALQRLNRHALGLMKWSLLPSSRCCRGWRLMCGKKLNVQLDVFPFAGPFKVLSGLVQCNKNADGTIKFIRLLQQMQMLPRAGKVMSRKLNLKNETWSSKWDQEKKKAQLIGEIKTQTINIIATFGGEFKNQFVWLVLKLFCQKPDKIIYFSVFLNLFNLEYSHC